MEVGEDAAFGGHAIEMRRLVRRCAEWADVGVAQVVDEDDDDIGRALWRRSSCGCCRQCAQLTAMREANATLRLRMHVAAPNA